MRDVKVKDKQDLNDRVEKCVAELTELSHMWNEDEFLNETSIREILSKNKHLSEHVIKQVTNKSQSAVPILEVLIHVITWAGKGKDHFARDCIQLVSVLRLQLVQALKDNSVSLYDVISMKNIRLKRSNDARFGVQVSFSTSLNDKDGMHDWHILCVDTILSVWSAVYQYLKYTQNRHFARMKKNVLWDAPVEEQQVVAAHSKGNSPFVGDAPVKYLTRQTSFVKLWREI